MRTLITSVAAVTICTTGALAQIAPLLAIDVTDEAGQPVAGAEAYLIQNDLPLSAGWVVANAEGRISIGMSELEDEEPPAGSVLAVVRAPSHAWAVAAVTMPDERELSVTLERGRALELVLTTEDSRPIPDDLEPIIYVPGQSVAAWLSGVQRTPSEEVDSIFSTAVLEPGREGRFNLRVPKACPPIYVIVNHPGFLRAFQAGPFEIEKNQLWVKLPATGAIDVTLAPREGVQPAYQACGADVYVAPDIPEGGWSFSIAAQDHEGHTLETRFDHLAPAGYSVQGFTGKRNQRHDRSRNDYFKDQTWVEVEAGEVRTTSFELETFDQERLRAELVGEHTVEVKLLRSDGSPAAGRSYDIGFSLQKFSRTLSIEKGEVPEDGTIRLENLPAAPLGILQVEIDGEYMGQLIVRKDEDQVAEFTIAPAVGEAAPDVTLVDLATGEEFALSSLRGQVVLLEFWASWCGPCQEPMAHNDRIMAERGASWADRAVIIGASIDDDIEVIRSHVDKRGWTSVRQAHCGDGAWKSGAASVYGVKMVPSAFLIDQEGTIVWAGHPASLEVEKRIDELLEG